MVGGPRDGSVVVDEYKLIHATVQSRGWCFTYNNYTDDDVERIKSIPEEKYRYLIFGREVGESGTPHLQGYIFARGHAWRMAAVKKLIGDGAHLAVARGSAKDNKTYCSKQDTEYFEAGILPADGTGARNDIGEAIEVLREGGMDAVAADAPREFVKYHRGLRELKQQWNRKRGRDGELRAVWLYGGTGVGKSFMARKIAGAFSLEYYTKEPDKWWDGYEEEKIVIMDDFRSGHYNFVYMLKTVDIYPLKKQAAGHRVNQLLCERFHS